MTIFPDYEQQLRELTARERTDYTQAPPAGTSRSRGWWRVPSRAVAVGLPVLVAVAVAAVFTLPRAPRSAPGAGPNQSAAGGDRRASA
jgi:hypothetical protein